MKRFMTLWRKEVLCLAVAPATHAVVVAFLFVAGLNLWRLAAQSDDGSGSLAMMLFGPLFFWIMILVLITAVTMRLFAEEKRLGTMETLLTVAVPDVDIVLAKYAAAMTVLAGAGAATLLMVAALRPFVPAGSAVDPGPVAAGYLILLLCGGFYASVGLLVSSLTRNHVLAGAVCFPVLGAMFFAEYFGSAFGGPFREAARYVSAPQHILTFAGGLVDSRPVVLYLSGTVFMLFAAVRVLESERWR